MITRTRSLRTLMAGVLLVVCGTAWADEKILDPTTNETWHYGTGMNNQVVEFSYNSCVAYKITIVNASDQNEEYFSMAYGAPSGNPVAQNIFVPDTGQASKGCIVEVEITHTDETKTTLKVGVLIKKP